MDVNILDKEERSRALDPERSFIMQAPAGSGKTSVLTQRMLCLLSTVTAPEQVVAITFTRKAASEMRGRIVAALQQAKKEPEPSDAYQKTTWNLARKVLQRDQREGWQLLNSPHRLRILTIDALCARITRASPILTHFGAQPEVLTDPSQCYLKAARNLLASLQTNPLWSNSLIKIMLHLDNNQAWVEELLVSMLARRDQWLPHIMQNHQREHLETGLQNAALDILTLCIEHIPSELMDELLQLFNFAANNLGLERISRAPTNDLKNFPEWLAIAEFIFNKSGTLRKSANVSTGFPASTAGSTKEEKELNKLMKERMTVMLNRLNDHPEFLENLVEVLFAPPLTYTEQQWQLISSLLEVLPILVAELHLQFKSHRAVDFIEISLAAIRALGRSDDPTQLALNLDYQIQHLLVDEFQDTSVTQYRLLELLTAGWQSDDGRTLFLVGDPMQSIYRFREAEVGLFLRARHFGLGHIPLHYLQLKMNFRSQQSIIAWLNQHFVDIFPHEENIATGAVPYASSLSTDHSEIESINVHALFEDNLETQAMRVVNIVQQEREKNPNNTIAILVRSRSHLYDILPELKRHGIRFQAVEVEKLSHCFVIRDLLSLTRALLHTFDRVAWLAVLRAPWCGLTLEDLHAIGSLHDKTILDACINTQLTEEGQIRLKPVITILRNALDQRQRSSLSDWILHTWKQLNGPNCVKSKAELDNANMFFKLLAQSDQGAVLPEISLIERQLDTLYAGVDANADPLLQVMTIHKAKGLEFDTVIIPALERRSAIDESSLLLWQERPRRDQDQADLLLAPIKYAGDEYDPIYRHVRRQQNQKGFFETIRLLYVALTRAKKSLHLLGTLPDDQSTPASNCFLGLLWEAVKDNFLTQKKSEHLPQEITNFAASKEIQRLFLQDLPQVPEYVPPHTAVNKIQIEIDECATKIGTVIHTVLQQIGEQGVEKSRDQDYHIDHLLIKAQVPLAEMNSARDIVTTAINNTLSDPFGQWILNENHQEAQCEYPLALFDQGEVLHFVLDRTFIDEEGVRWIIDYKTSQLRDGQTLDEFLLQEKRAYYLQLSQYAKAMNLIEQRPIKLCLYFPLIKKSVVWNYDDEKMIFASPLVGEG